MVEYLRVLNSGELDQLSAYIRRSHHPNLLAQVPLENLVARNLWINRLYGHLDSVVFQKVNENSAMVWTRGRVTKAWIGFHFFFGDSPPFRIRAIGRDHGQIPPKLHRIAPAIDERTLVEQLDRLLDGLEGTPHFSGSVLLAHRGTPLLERSVGWSDPARTIPNRNESGYRIASLSKMFVGVAVAQLVEEGKINFNDLVGRHIVEFPKPMSEVVTVRHLLTHSSGIELDDVPGFADACKRAANACDLVAVQIKFMASVPAYRRFELPKEPDYSNEGFAILACIIERASGQPYVEFLKRRILIPSGLAYTAGHDDETLRRNLSTGLTYRRATDGVYLPGEPRVCSSSDTYPHPAGGLVSTTQDLLRFWNRLLAGELVRPNTVREITGAQVKAGGGKHYGFGFVRMETEAGPCVGHHGQVFGYSAILDYYENSEICLIVLANMEEAADQIGLFVRELLCR